jgi:hypothetical protein
VNAWTHLYFNVAPHRQQFGWILCQVLGPLENSKDAGLVPKLKAAFGGGSEVALNLVRQMANTSSDPAQHASDTVGEMERRIGRLMDVPVANTPEDTIRLLRLYFQNQASQRRSICAFHRFQQRSRELEHKMEMDKLNLNARLLRQQAHDRLARSREAESIRRRRSHEQARQAKEDARREVRRQWDVWAALQDQLAYQQAQNCPLNALKWPAAPFEGTRQNLDTASVCITLGSFAGMDAHNMADN